MSLQPHDPKAIGHDGSHITRQLSAKVLFWVIIIQFIVMVVELVVSLLVSKSVALLSDAFHMITHLIATIGSFAATMYALKSRPKSDATFRYWRIEILISFINSIILFPFAGFLIYESLLRFYNPVNFNISIIILVGSIGLVSNLICAFITHKQSHHDLNVKSIYIHMLADGLSSVGVILAALCSYFFNTVVFDPAIALVISGIMVYWAVMLFKEAATILLEIAPKQIDVNKVQKEINAFDFVKRSHDLHIWTITNGLYALTCHVVIHNNHDVEKTVEYTKVLDEMVMQKFNIRHTCIQYETERVKEVLK